MVSDTALTRVSAIDHIEGAVGAHSPNGVVPLRIRSRDAQRFLTAAHVAEAAYGHHSSQKRLAPDSVLHAMVLITCAQLYVALDGQLFDLCEPYGFAAGPAESESDRGPYTTKHRQLQLKHITKPILQPSHDTHNKPCMEASTVSSA